jgi:hypothetical protein
VQVKRLGEYMSVAVMQPYLFPYLGYYQLVESSDVFVFYDDVDFIKRGWINRNKILLNDAEFGFSVPCLRPVYQTKICNVSVDYDSFSINKFFKTLHHAYAKMENFQSVNAELEKFFSVKYENIGAMAAASISLVFDYVNVEKKFYFSSQKNYQNQHLSRAERLMDIVKKEHSNVYINAIGGTSLYQKDDFLKEGVELKFLKPELNIYPQISKSFLPGLSIIDVLMMCPKDDVRKMLQDYTLA